MTGVQTCALPICEAEKAGFKTVDEIGRERIIRAAKKIKEENPDTTADLGFKHYTLAEVSQTTLDKIEKFDNSGFITDTTIYDEFGYCNCAYNLVGTR